MPSEAHGSQSHCRETCAEGYRNECERPWEVPYLRSHLQPFLQSLHTAERGIFQTKIYSSLVCFRASGLIHPHPNSCLCPMKKGLYVCLLMLLPQPGPLLPFSSVLPSVPPVSLTALICIHPSSHVLPVPLHLLPGASSLPSEQIHHPHPSHHCLFLAA